MKGIDWVNGMLSGFLTSVEKYPLAKAIVLDEKGYSYQELLQAADNIYQHLSRVAIDLKGKRVAILGGKNIETYSSVIAVLLGGGTFVPLNPSFPTQRNRYIFEASQADILLTTSALGDYIGEMKARLPSLECVCVDRICTSGARSVAEICQYKPVVGEHEHAYILFTSGSTGNPKGVPIHHRNVTAFLAHNLKQFQFKPSDRFSQTFDLTFDLSIFDLFIAWSVGACVYPLQPCELLSPVAFVNKHQLTVWFSVPSVVLNSCKLGLLEPNAMPSLRTSLFCGEALSKEIVEHWLHASPNTRVFNLYGPTELTIACADYEVTEAVLDLSYKGLVPIGRVYSNHTYLLLDEQGKEVDEGELCISGPQCFSGYLGLPEISNAKLFVDQSSRQTFYRTGDLVKKTSGQNLVFVGRVDHQVKIQGYRIELMEVEQQLRKLGCIDVVALPYPSYESPQQIAVAILGQKDDDDVALLKKHLSLLLPKYMTPHYYETFDNFPLNSNGKVDRNELLANIKKRKDLIKL
ncbi:amino acid adenylation domain-containing protein (plasmid) [Vibrio tubiashii]|uniref:amino acid adenylation domain-containing protein n=1 Tax=Vibrio tubiashii TaxID=29498 RepID=UPI00234E93E6|nr:amino acid adenylation domain-containing protein [Vibrio tubiashii]WCP70347.1 amino acid adenylation domain-containing protein [Vibrio tubiashii]